MYYLKADTQAAACPYFDIFRSNCHDSCHGGFLLHFSVSSNDTSQQHQQQNHSSITDAANVE